MTGWIVIASVPKSTPSFAKADQEIPVGKKPLRLRRHHLLQ
jgi:hypothetical protein